MALIGILIALIGAAVGIVVGAVGGLIGIGLGFLGWAIGLLPHLVPAVLIAFGVIWLLQGSNPRSVASRADHRDAGQPPSVCNPR